MVSMKNAQVRVEHKKIDTSTGLAVCPNCHKRLVLDEMACPDGVPG